MSALATGSVGDALRTLVSQRAVLQTEIVERQAAADAIDRELDEIRRLLGVSVSIAAPPVTPEPTEPSPSALMRRCQLCGQPYDQRSPRQKVCVACRERIPHRAVADLAGAGEPDSTCERCGARFKRKPLTTGRFCSRACYCSKPARRAVIVAPVPTARPDATDVVERRDAAVQQRIGANNGVATIQELHRWFTNSPHAPSAGDTVKFEALQNSLHRLKAKGLIARTGDTWSLVGAGVAHV